MYIHIYIYMTDYFKIPDQGFSIIILYYESYIYSLFIGKYIDMQNIM
jgi:hypothetical protein